MKIIKRKRPKKHWKLKAAWYAVNAFAFASLAIYSQQYAHRQGNASPKEVAAFVESQIASLDKVSPVDCGGDWLCELAEQNKRN